MPDSEANAVVDKLSEIAQLLQQLLTEECQPKRRLLRVSEASHYLHVSPWQLRGLIQRGELPVVKIRDNGHSPFLIDKSDCDQWIERAKVTIE